MNTRFLGNWVGVFGGLFLLAAAGLQFWHFADPDPSGRLLGYAAALSLSGGTLVTLGMACQRIARLEYRVQELERQRKSAGVVVTHEGNG